MRLITQIVGRLEKRWKVELSPWQQVIGVDDGRHATIMKAIWLRIDLRSKTGTELCEDVTHIPNVVTAYQTWMKECIEIHLFALVWVQWTTGTYCPQKYYQCFQGNWANFSKWAKLHVAFFHFIISSLDTDNVPHTGTGGLCITVNNFEEASPNVDLSVSLSGSVCLFSHLWLLSTLDTDLLTQGWDTAYGCLKRASPDNLQSCEWLERSEDCMCYGGTTVGWMSHNILQ